MSTLVRWVVKLTSTLLSRRDETHLTVLPIICLVLSYIVGLHLDVIIAQDLLVGVRVNILNI